jgi:hypothetical protein
MAEMGRTQEETKRSRKVKDLQGKLHRLEHARRILREELKQAEQNWLVSMPRNAGEPGC